MKFFEDFLFNIVTPIFGVTFKWLLLKTAPQLQETILCMKLTLLKYAS